MTFDKPVDAEFLTLLARYRETQAASEAALLAYERDPSPELYRAFRAACEPETKARVAFEARKSVINAATPMGGLRRWH